MKLELQIDLMEKKWNDDISIKYFRKADQIVAPVVSTALVGDPTRSDLYIKCHKLNCTPLNNNEKNEVEFLKNEIHTFYVDFV